MEKADSAARAEEPMELQLTHVYTRAAAARGKKLG